MSRFSLLCILLITLYFTALSSRTTLAATPIHKLSNQADAYTAVFAYDAGTPSHDVSSAATVSEQTGEVTSTDEFSHSADIFSNTSHHSLSHHESVEFDSMRTTLLGSKWMSDTKQSSSNSMSFLRNFPRKKADGSAGTNILQRLGGPANGTATTAAEKDPIMDYIAGMFFMWGVPVFFAMLSIVCWFGFCIARCWCNACGRHATHLYTEKQIRVNYVLVICLITIMGVCCAFGWTGNVQVSEGIDQGFVAADMWANYGYEFMGVFSTAYAIGYDAMLLGQSFNSTMASLPDDTDVIGAQACTNSSYNRIGTQQAFVQDMKGLTQYFTDNTFFTAAQIAQGVGVGQVAQAQQDLSTTQSPVPVDGQSGNTLLQNLNKQLSDLNTAMSSLPDVNAVNTLITDLAIVQGYSSAGNTMQALQSLTTTFRSMNAAAAQASPILTSFLSTHFTTLENGITALGSSLDNAIAGSLSSSTTASALNSNFYQVLISINSSFPQDMGLFQTNLAQFQTALTTINSSLPILTGAIAGYKASITPTYWPASNSVYGRVKTEIQPIADFQTNYGLSLQNILANELPILIQDLNNMKANIPRAIAAFNATQWQVSEVDQYVDTDYYGRVIQQFNSTFGSLACFSQTFDLLEFVNSTFAIVPQSVTTLRDNMKPIIIQQVAALPEIYLRLNNSFNELLAVNASAQASAQPNYNGLTVALSNLYGVVNSMSNYSVLFEELLNLNVHLSDLTTADIVDVQRSSSNASAPILWSNVIGVSARDQTDVYSSLDSFADIYNNVQMSSTLSGLTSLITSLQNKLGGNEFSGSYLQAVTTSVSKIASGMASANNQIRALYPVTTMPLSATQQNALVPALIAFRDAINNRTSSSDFQNYASDLDNSLSGGPSPTLADLKKSVYTLNTALQTLPNMSPLLLRFQSNATQAAQPTLQQVVSPPGELMTLNTALQSSSALISGENVKVQAMFNSFTLPNINIVMIALNTPGLFMTSTDRDNLYNNLGKFIGFRSHLPDFNEQIQRGQDGVDAISGALSYMEEKKQSYQKHKTDFANTIENYDGVRLLVFNLGVLLPFVLSFFLLIAAIQHYGCPAMIAGLMFFPLFALFMLMSAVQMPVSVALSDHCYNPTAEIKIQTAGRVYPADKLTFFQLSSDIDIPSVTDYFTGCIGAPPELLQKLGNPLPLLQANGLESSKIQSDAYAAIGLPFAEPLASDFQQLDAIQQRTLDLFTLAVSKLNCTRSSEIYQTTIDFLCVDFGPAFALTTCVFLLAGICMVPGICIGVTSYKRFNPLNRDTAYSKAPQHEEEIPEGWN